MAQRALHTRWQVHASRCERPPLTSYQRALRQARRTAALRRPFDWEHYQPLAPGDPLEARDSVEGEVWAKIEYEARERQRERAGLPPEELVPHDIKAIRVLWAEARREWNGCERRKK